MPEIVNTFYITFLWSSLEIDEHHGIFVSESFYEKTVYQSVRTTGILCRSL